MAKLFFKPGSTRTTSALVPRHHATKKKGEKSWACTSRWTSIGEVKGSVKLEYAAFPRRREAGAAVGDQTSLHPSPFARNTQGHTSLNPLPRTVPGYTELKLRHRKNEQP